MMQIQTSASVVFRIFLWLFMLLGGSVLAFVLDENSLLFQSIWFHVLSASFGVIVITLSFRAAANAGRELAKGRDAHTPRLETNKLVRTGLYSCMRHPMLFGLTLLPLGWALLLGSPTFIIVIAPLEMLFIIFMVIVFEEMEIKKKFTQEYEDYIERVPMISLRAVCLSKLFKNSYK